MTIKFPIEFLNKVSLIFAMLIALSGLPTFVGAAAQRDDSTCKDAKVSATYRLRAGDQIQVFYRVTPEYNQTATILSDGTVGLQIVGEMNVAGLKLEQARLAIQHEAAKRLENPEVALTVSDMERDHFEVLGEVDHPGRFELRGCINAVDAIAMAGGPKLASAKEKVILVHRLPNSADYGEAQLVNFGELSRGKSKVVPLIQNGDVLIVGLNGLTKIERIIHLLNLGLYYGLQ